MEQGPRFWCTLSGCQQTAAMGRLWPGCHLLPSSAHSTSCPPKDWPRLADLGPETAQHWAGTVGRAGRQPGQQGQEGGKTTTNKPARPVTEKEAGGWSGLTAQLHRGEEGILGARAVAPEPPAQMASAALPQAPHRCHGGFRHHRPPESLSQASFAACC